MGNYTGTFGVMLLDDLGCPVTSENKRFLAAWAVAEGGTAHNNPFNTTEAWPNATMYNAQGVRNYASITDGLSATARTLRNGHYGPILTSLHLGNDAMECAKAVANSPWGTGDGVIKVLQVQGVPVPPNGGEEMTQADWVTLTQIVHDQIVNVMRSPEFQQIVKRCAMQAIEAEK